MSDEDHIHPGAVADPHRGPVFEPFDIVIPVPGLLRGLWVTSYAGFLQNTQPIQDPFAPPQTAGYDVSYNAAGEPNVFKQREGFFHTAALITYVFDGMGKLTGYMESVRGGYDQHNQIAITGTYEAWRTTTSTGHFLYWGRVYTIIPAGNRNFYFVRKNPYELELIWTPPPLETPPANKHSQPRPLIARGTLTKVREVGWFGRAIQRLILG